jgi:hypothetical protein
MRIVWGLARESFLQRGRAPRARKAATRRTHSKCFAMLSRPLNLGRPPAGWQGWLPEQRRPNCEHPLYHRPASGS